MRNMVTSITTIVFPNDYSVFSKIRHSHIAIRGRGKKEEMKWFSGGESFNTTFLLKGEKEVQGH